MAALIDVNTREVLARDVCVEENHLFSIGSMITLTHGESIKSYRIKDIVSHLRLTPTDYGWMSAKAKQPSDIYLELIP